MQPYEFAHYSSHPIQIFYPQAIFAGHNKNYLSPCGDNNILLPAYNYPLIYHHNQHFHRLHQIHFHTDNKARQYLNNK